MEAEQEQAMTTLVVLTGEFISIIWRVAGMPSPFHLMHLGAWCGILQGPLLR
jgi:hypothetical protein